jgi:hypothetical protein
MDGNRSVAFDELRDIAGLPDSQNVVFIMSI